MQYPKLPTAVGMLDSIVTIMGTVTQIGSSSQSYLPNQVCRVPHEVYIEPYTGGCDQCRLVVRDKTAT